MNIEDLKYPIGQHVFKNEASEATIKDAIDTLIMFPSWLEMATTNLDAFQLNTPYRPDGWTIAQVVHHCADSHSNCLVRLKLALTETNPTICAYLEAEWAKCADYDLPINNSLTLIHCIHKKLVAIFQNMTATDFQKTYYHPEHKASFTLIGLLNLYAWHCKHHLAHIQNLRTRNNW